MSNRRRIDGSGYQGPAAARGSRIMTLEENGSVLSVLGSQREAAVMNKEQSLLLS